MNWYKKAQQLELEEDHGKNYTDYGHDIYHDRLSKKYKPNYMWEYINGEIDVEEETEEIYGHDMVNRWYFTNKVYSGRYDGSTGIITLVKPYDNIARYKNVPSILQYKLRKAFPEAHKIMVF